MAKKKQCGRILSNSIKSLDVYGMPINLTFKGDSTYKTFIGGWLSIVSYLFLGLFLSMLAKDLV